MAFWWRSALWPGWSQASSWPADQYAPGGPQPSFDKQFVRDYLEQIQWNKQAPAPALPDDIVAKTQRKYLDAYRLLTGRELDLG